MISCTSVIKTSNWWRSFIFVSQLYRRRHYFINLVRKIKFFKSRQIWRWATYHIFLIFAEIDIDEHSQTTSVDVIFEFFLRLYFFIDEKYDNSSKNPSNLTPKLQTKSTRVGINLIEFVSEITSAFLLISYLLKK